MLFFFRFFKESTETKLPNFSDVSNDLHSPKIKLHFLATVSKIPIYTALVSFAA